MSDDLAKLMEADAEASPIPASGELASLSILIKSMRQIEKEKQELEESLVEKDKQLKQVQCVDIPTLMSQMGVESFKTEEGLVVRVNKKYFCGITKERSDEAITWLVDNGHIDMIKRDVAANFTKGQTERAKELMSILDAHGFSYKTKEFVHPQTLKAFVRTEMEDGRPLPVDLFGVYVENVAEVKLK